MLGPAVMPPSAYHLPTLSSILLEKELSEEMFFPPLDGFSRTFYAYVLHTHIYEWRQNVCMLNSNSLTGNILSYVPRDIGSGLREHKQWLLKALEVWSEHYGSSDSSDSSTKNYRQAGSLLHHLGDLALRISFADLYVLAGRSSTTNDVSTATESICNTLAVDRACSIFDHSFKMIGIALDVHAAGESRFCGFEMVISLFIGGLLLWTTHHLRSRPELAAVMGWINQSGVAIQSATSSAVGTGDSTIVRKLQDVIGALKATDCVGYASLLASVLQKLCDEGVSSDV